MLLQNHRYVSAGSFSLPLSAICLILTSGLSGYPSLIADERDYDAIAANLENQRREAAKRELEELRQNRKTSEDRINFAKIVVRASFHSEQGYLPKPLKQVKAFERWKQTRLTAMQGLVEHPERFAGDITSGKVLNFFLQECGPTAFANRTLAVHAVQQPMQASTDNLRLPLSTTKHIQYRQGITGAKLTGRLNQDPLDTRWVVALRGVAFQPHTKKIERFREKTLHELRQGQPVSAKAADELVDAVNDLREEVQSRKRDALGRIGGGGPRPHQEYFQLLEAEKQVQKLTTGALRIVEAHELDDIVFDKIEGLQDGITIEELLSYMHQHSLTFGASDSNGQAAYNSLFQMMVRYYVEMCAWENAIKEDDSLRAREYELQQIELGNRMSSFQLGQILIEAMRAF
jgi:hypothetical protein